MSSSSLSSSLINSSVDSLHLRQHQKKLIKRMLQPQTHHRQLFVAGTGSGKTIASIISAVYLIKANIVKNVHIIVPKGVFDQFQSQVYYYVPKPLQSKFNLFTHQTYFTENNKHNVSNTFIIIDEAHALTTPIEVSQDGHIKAGVYAYYATQHTQHCKALLLLTATPMANNPVEMFNLVCMLVGQEYKTFYTKMHEFRKIMISQSKDFIKTGFKSIVKKTNLQLSLYAQMIAPNILFARKSQEGFPRKVEKIIRITMDKTYLDIYNAIEETQFKAFNQKLIKSSSKKYIFDPESEDAFYINLRRAVNGVTEDVYSKKIEYTIKLVKKCYQSKQRIIIYSNFIDGGLSLIKTILDKKKVLYSEYTGKSSQKHRAECMKQINNGERYILLLSRAGSEGLDLKCIRHVVLLEPHFHNERLRQVVGRAVRFRSHDDLPPHERVVYVHHLLLCKPVEGDSWEHRNQENIQTVQTLIEKYRATAETSEIILHMNAINRLFFNDVLLSLHLPMDLFTIDTQQIKQDDYNIYVKVIGGLALFLKSETEYDDIISTHPPSTNISVDEILHKISLRKQYIIQQHLLLLRNQRKIIKHSETTSASSIMKTLQTQKAYTSQSSGHSMHSTFKTMHANVSSSKSTKKSK